MKYIDVDYTLLRPQERNIGTLTIPLHGKKVKIRCSEKYARWLVNTDRIPYGTFDMGNVLVHI
jgi:hypothetical protein